MNPPTAGLACPLRPSTSPSRRRAAAALALLLAAAAPPGLAQSLGDLVNKVEGSLSGDKPAHDSAAPAGAPAAAGSGDGASPAGGFLDKLKNTVLGRANREAGSVGVFDTRLKRLLIDHPPKDAQNPEWPRIAISDVRIPPRMLAASNRAVSMGAIAWDQDVHQTMAPSDCFYFTATVWDDAKTSEVLRNVSLCGADLAALHEVAGGRPTGIDGGRFLTYSTSFASGVTTGPARTTGPNPPLRMIGERDYTSPVIGKGMGMGAWFVNAMALVVGFDSSYDRRRLWFVNFKDS